MHCFTEKNADRLAIFNLYVYYLLRCAQIENKRGSGGADGNASADGLTVEEVGIKSGMYPNLNDGFRCDIGYTFDIGSVCAADGACARN